MDERMNETAAAIADARLTFEGVLDLMEDLLEGLMSGEIEATDAVARLHVMTVAMKSGISDIASVDEILAKQ